MKSKDEEQPLEGELIGIDVGEKNIGMARVNTLARIAEPLDVIKAGPEAFTDVLTAVQEHGAVGIVIGLPRGLDGQETSQTAKTKQFASELAELTDLPIYMVDEAGTTREAENRLVSNPSASIDSLAATVFLEDFVHSAKQSLMRYK